LLNECVPKFNMFPKIVHDAHFDNFVSSQHISKKMTATFSEYIAAEVIKNPTTLGTRRYTTL